MFQALAPSSKLETSLDRTVGLQRSINVCQFPQGEDAVDARAYVVGAFDPGRGYTVYVLYTPTGSGGPVLYVSEGGAMPLGKYPRVEREALDVVERHGFVMEPVDLVGLAGAEKAKILHEIPFAHPTVSLSVNGVGSVSSSGPPAQAGARGQSGSRPLDGGGFGIPAQEAIASLGRLLAIF